FRLARGRHAGTARCGKARQPAGRNTTGSSSRRNRRNGEGRYVTGVTDRPGCSRPDGTPFAIAGPPACHPTRPLPRPESLPMPTALIVEDDDPVRTVFRHMLEGEGYRTL